MANLLVIEDEENLRFTIRRALTKSGYHVTDVATLKAAREAIAGTDFDVVLTDVMLGAHDNGLEFVKELREPGSGFDGSVVVMTAFSSIENAVAAMRLGADDYIQKPLSLEELSIQVTRWVELRQLKKRVKLYQRLEKSREQETEVVGESAAWRATLSMADRLAAIPLAGSGVTGAMNGMLGGGAGGGLPCILISGETGAGKGVLARYIHARACGADGKGQDAPFVHVNCSALPATLVESELFGHEKGAFTDAREAKPGLFEMADGGTIFLDEVSETPLEFQAKLLTVVEHGVYRRVGGSKERSVRVRVIAASNQNLEERVRAGAFRRDLLYRLNAFVVRLPALRDRGSDAVLIAEAMLERLGRRYGRSDKRLSDASRVAIQAHDWPGNVRELVNAVQRGVMLSDGAMIEPDDLGLTTGPVQGLGVPNAGAPAAAQSRIPERMLATPMRIPGEHGHGHANGNGTSGGNGHGGTSGAPTVESGLVPTFDFVRGVHTVTEVEKELIMQALKFTRGNVSRAAKLIGMQRSSIRYRIERYGLDRYVLEVANK